MMDEPLLVLHIDDEIGALTLFNLMLQRYGYDALKASGPREGLALAFERRPHIILLDNMMPDMDGYEVCRRLRADERTRKAVIIFLSPSLSADRLELALKCGADDGHARPMYPSSVREMMATWAPIAMERRHAKTQIIIGGDPDSTR